MSKLKHQQFLKAITDTKLKTKVKMSIIKAYAKRKRGKQTQEEIADKGLLSLSSVKKVEQGKCYDLKIINEYIKSI